MAKTRVKRVKLARKAKVAKPQLARLDEGGSKYLRLLSDPCGADLVPVAGASGGSSYTVRTKQIIAPTGAHVDGFFMYNPLGNAGLANGFGQWSIAGTASGVLGVVGGNVGPAFLSSSFVKEYRPVAGCLRFIYTGSELNRSGTVYSAISPKPEFIAGESGLGTVDGSLGSSVMMRRLGECVHEVKWVPLSPRCTEFQSANQPSVSGDADFGTTVGFYYKGVPAGAFYVEATFVWEWVPINNGGMPTTLSRPPSMFSQAALISRLGDLTRWATDPTTAQKAVSIAKGVYAVANYAKAALAVV